MLGGKMVEYGLTFRGREWTLKLARTWIMGKGATTAV